MFIIFIFGLNDKVAGKLIHVISHLCHTDDNLPVTKLVCICVNFMPPREFVCLVLYDINKNLTCIITATTVIKFLYYSKLIFSYYKVENKQMKGH